MKRSWWLVLVIGFAVTLFLLWRRPPLPPASVWQNPTSDPYAEGPYGPPPQNLNP